MVKLGRRVRDDAAKLCSARASAEAAGIQIVGSGGHAFTPDYWDKRAQRTARSWTETDNEEGESTETRRADVRGPS